MTSDRAFAEFKARLPAAEYSVTSTAPTQAGCFAATALKTSMCFYADDAAVTTSRHLLRCSLAPIPC